MDSPVIIIAIVIACLFQAVVLTCSKCYRGASTPAEKRTVSIVFSLYFHCPLVYLSALYTVFSSSNSSRYFIEVIHSSIYIRSTDPCGHNAPLRSLRVGNRRGNTIDFIKARKKKKKKKTRGTCEVLVLSFHPICYLFTCVSCLFDHLA